MCSPGRMCSAYLVAALFQANKEIKDYGSAIKTNIAIMGLFLFVSFGLWYQSFVVR